MATALPTGAVRSRTRTTRGAPPLTAAALTPPPAEAGTGGLRRWVSAGLRCVEGPESGGAGDEDEELAADCRTAAAHLLRPWTADGEGTGAIAALARRIPAHVSNHLARGWSRRVSWQWKLMTVAWVMEQCGIHTLVGNNRQEALAHIEALGLLAAANRALPFVGWATGRATTTPGVNIPGMRHRNPLIFDTAVAHRGGAAERLLERVLRRIEDRNSGSQAHGEPDGGQEGKEPGDVDMSENTAVREGNNGGHGNRGEAIIGAEVREHPGRPDEDQKDDHAGHPDGGDGPGYTSGTGGPAPCEPPYSGTPTGAAQSGELRDDLQRGPGASHGQKRGSSPAAKREAELLAVKRCLDDGPEWSARSNDRGPSRGAGRVYLPSLFDGVGTAMLAMVELFAALGCQDRFAGGWFVESEDHLASPVAKHWVARRKQGGPSFDRVAGDIWDLLKHGGRALAGMLAEIEPGAMLITVGGSPCQQLTIAGRHGGREGLCGGDSWNFYGFPLILHAARCTRPDIDVHVTVEKAGSMMEKIKVAIVRALGISTRDASAGVGPRGLELADGCEFAPVTDARRFSPYTRKRVFFSTLPSAKDQWTIRGGRPPPWDEGWERRSSSGLGPLRDMPPMMRGRGPYPGIKPSAYQFHPNFLLYSGNILNIAHYRVIPAITSTMPPHVREGFRGIIASRGPTGSGARDPDRERKADATAQWMHENGAPLVFRVPKASERRARAFGMGQYLMSLGLSGKELFDATGNMFDKDALLVRIGCPIKRWVSGEPMRSCANPTPTQIGIEYGALRDSSTAEGAKPRYAPVQADMPGLLDEMEGWNLCEDAKYRGGPGVPARSVHPRNDGRGAHGRGRAAGGRSGARARAGPAGGLGPNIGRDLVGLLGIAGLDPPHRGAVGGLARVGQGNYCVMDSLAQVLDGAPKACTEPRAERKAEEATGEIRMLCRIAGAGIVPTVATWI